MDKGKSKGLFLRKKVPYVSKKKVTVQYLFHNGRYLYVFEIF